MSVVIVETTAQPAPNQPDLASLWWLPLVSGLASIGVGIAALVNPSRTLTAIALLFGIYLLFAGAIEIGLAIADRGDGRTARVLFGLFAIVAGLLVIRHPGDSLLFVSLATGIFLVLAGIVRFVRAMSLPAGRGLPLVASLVDFAAGVVLVAWPEFSIKTFSIVLGISLLCRGAIDIAAAIMLRRAT